MACLYFLFQDIPVHCSDDCGHCSDDCGHCLVGCGLWLVSISCSKIFPCTLALFMFEQMTDTLEYDCLSLFSCSSLSSIISAASLYCVLVITLGCCLKLRR